MIGRRCLCLLDFFQNKENGLKLPDSLTFPPVIVFLELEMSVCLGDLSLRCFGGLIRFQRGTF